MSPGMTLRQLSYEQPGGLLDWSLDRLAEASGLPKRTLIRMEGGDTRPRDRTEKAVRNALEAAGVEFIAENGEGAGVRLR